MDINECKMISAELDKIKIEEMDLMDQAVICMAYAEFISKVGPVVKKYMKRNEAFEKSFSNFTGLFGSIKEDDNK